jgi:hypothetical protein
VSGQGAPDNCRFMEESLGKKSLTNRLRSP